MMNEEKPESTQQEKWTYSVTETAKILGVGINTAYELVNSKALPSLRLKRRIVVPKAALEKFLESAITNE